MPLTPAEVHNVAFKKPPIGKRGYDEEEVDAFLDIVEVELSRLIEENNDLRSRGANGAQANGAAETQAVSTSKADVKLDFTQKEKRSALVKASLESEWDDDQREALDAFMLALKLLYSVPKGASISRFAARANMDDCAHREGL